MFRWFKSLFSPTAPTIGSVWHLSGSNPWKKKYYVVKKVEGKWVRLSGFYLDGEPLTHDYDCTIPFFYKIFTPYK